MKSPATLESPSLNPTKVLLAEDHKKFRETLKILVETDGDIQVVGEAKNGCEAVQLQRSLNPDVVVMDIAMPLLNGLEATQQIMEMHPTARVLILSSHPDAEYVRQAMISGASGYLIKQSSTQLLAEAVREVLKGNTFFSTSIPKTVSDECRGLFGKRELRRKNAAKVAPSG